MIKRIERINNVRALKIKAAYPGGVLLTFVADDKSGRTNEYGIISRPELSYNYGYLAVSKGNQVQENDREIVVVSPQILSAVGGPLVCANHLHGQMIIEGFAFQHPGDLNVGDSIKVPSAEQAERMLTYFEREIDFCNERGFPRYDDDVKEFEGESPVCSDYHILSRLTSKEVSYNRMHGLR